MEVKSFKISKYVYMNKNDIWNDVLKLIIEKDEQYEPPYTLDQIKSNYSKDMYDELSKCPIHRWRAETGIELIHKEPSLKELERIWKNWQLMPQELKDKSDEKSKELFNCTNAEHYNKLKSKYQV